MTYLYLLDSSLRSLSELIKGFQIFGWAVLMKVNQKIGSDASTIYSVVFFTERDPNCHRNT